ncbi:tuberoinfundibular peptide of 39 residues [Tiliqua scincoides]|uniref:tuberoinfundibular peptide of 39 residues n=1 Tax=Tiliqua scincoides TaxID=71010 RepID=UPI003462FD13
MVVPLKATGSLSMEPVAGARKGLLPIIVFLSSCLLVSSGLSLQNSGRLRKPEASQFTPQEHSVDLKAALVPWDIRIPFITLRDWSLKWMSSDVITPQDEGSEGQNRKSHLWSPVRQEALPSESQKMLLYPASWLPRWGGKRSIVVADDAAFREKSKLLTAMERQKWLNSYMQKLLVVNSD